MFSQEWLMPSIYGAAFGAGALALLGFSYGGWVTGGAAEAMAVERSESAVVLALVPFCVAKSQADPDVTRTLAQIEDARIHERTVLLMKTGWATLPGSDTPDRKLAEACFAHLKESP